MKRHLFYLPALSAMLVFAAACSDEIAGRDTPPREPEITATNGANAIALTSDEMTVLRTMGYQSPKISQDEAIDIAARFLGKSSLSKSTAAVRCNVLTRQKPSISKSGTTDTDTMMYVLNYGNNEGYALICADIRVPDQVFAYSETGSMDTDTDNPGVQLFMDMAVDYMDASIAEVESKRDSLRVSAFDKLGVSADENSDTKRLSKYSMEQIKCTTMGSSITVKNHGRVDALIKTEWGQGKPYNDKCGGSATGCVPIAVAQILAYWKYPDIYNNIILDWNTILNGSKDDTDYKEKVSTFVAMVRAGLGTKGTSTKKRKALKYFRTIFCSTQSQMYDYKYDKVTKALDDGMPVYIRGNRGSSGHAWIADGYLKRDVTKSETIKYMIIEHKDDGKTSYRYEDITESWTTSYRLIHFNWGWGNGNGYYNNNVFDTDKKMVEDNNHDGYFHYEPAGTSERHYYNKNIEIITDIKPRY